MRFLASWWRVFAELLVLALLGLSLVLAPAIVIHQGDAIGDATSAAVGLSETLLVFLFGALFYAVAHEE